MIDVDYRGRKYQREITRDLFDQLIEPIVEYSKHLVAAHFPARSATGGS